MSLLMTDEARKLAARLLDASSRCVSPPQSWSVDCAYLLLKLSAALNAAIEANVHLAAKVGSNQARIDELMLEFCENEMTEEQRAEWWSRQVPAPDQSL